MAGSLPLNWYFTPPPVHSLTIADPKNRVAVAIFIGVAVAVASVVDLAARRTHQAARLRAESEILSLLKGNVLRGAFGGRGPGSGRAAPLTPLVSGPPPQARDQSRRPFSARL